MDFTTSSRHASFIIVLFLLIGNHLNAQNIASNFRTLNGQQITTVVKIEKNHHDSTINMQLMAVVKNTWLTKFEKEKNDETLITKALKKTALSVDFGGHIEKADSDDPNKASNFIGLSKASQPTTRTIDNKNGAKILPAPISLVDSTWNNGNAVVFDSTLYLNGIFFPSIIPAKAKKGQTLGNEIVLTHSTITNTFTITDINEKTITLTFKSNRINTITPRERLKMYQTGQKFNKEVNYNGTLIVNTTTLVIESENYESEVVPDLSGSNSSPDNNKSEFGKVAITNTLEKI